MIILLYCHSFHPEIAKSDVARIVIRYRVTEAEVKFLFIVEDNMVAVNKIAVALLMLLTTLAFTTNASPFWHADKLIPDNVEEIKRNYISSGLYKGEKFVMRFSRV